MIDTLILAVIYNTHSETIRFLKSIELQKHDGIHVMLVDNSTIHVDSSFEKIINEIKINLTYLKSGANLGYFGGADFGLNAYLKKNKLPQWIIVSNVDIVFDQAGFFSKLNSINAGFSIGVIAPAIISNRAKTDANPKIVKRYTKEKMQFFLKVCANTFTQNAYGLLSFFKKKIKYLTHKKSSNLSVLEVEPRKIYGPHGSCILFSQNYFNRGGNLRHISFLFGEEIFVAETARNLNLDVLYMPQLRVDDYEHASTGFFYSKKIAGFMKQSTIDIIKHYYSV